MQRAFRMTTSFVPRPILILFLWQLHMKPPRMILLLFSFSLWSGDMKENERWSGHLQSTTCLISLGNFTNDFIIDIKIPDQIRFTTSFHNISFRRFLELFARNRGFLVSSGSVFSDNFFLRKNTLVWPVHYIQMKINLMDLGHACCTRRFFINRHSPRLFILKI